MKIKSDTRRLVEERAEFEKCNGKMFLSAQILAVLEQSNIDGALSMKVPWFTSLLKHLSTQHEELAENMKTFEHHALQQFWINQVSTHHAMTICLLNFGGSSCAKPLPPTSESDDETGVAVGNIIAKLVLSATPETPVPEIESLFRQVQPNLEAHHFYILLRVAITSQNRQLLELLWSRRNWIKSANLIDAALWGEVDKILHRIQRTTPRAKGPLEN